ncbi:MAG TPA: ferritin-like domain-containing protein [Microbacteriaceae bacterium]|nr:ferritin-like domain-containing protein [Microbacteriaceae bacterium]
MKLHSLESVLSYKLGVALSMEHDSLAMLGELESAASSAEVKHLFSHHADETREQIEHLEQVFERTGLEPKEKPSPTTKGLATEGSSLLEKVDEPFRDAVALSAAGGTEHFEIATYRSLISLSEALGQSAAVELLSSNLEQEEHTSTELERVLKEVLGGLRVAE